MLGQALCTCFRGWWGWWKVQKTEKLTLGIFPSGYLWLTSNSKSHQMGSKEKVATGAPSSPCWDLAPPAETPSPSTKNFRVRIRFLPANPPYKAATGPSPRLPR